jgi:hypothetical protein
VCVEHPYYPMIACCTIKWFEVLFEGGVGPEEALLFIVVELLPHKRLNLRIHMGNTDSSSEVKR